MNAQYGYCTQKCLENYYAEIYAGIELFALEKESKLTFDPLYVADLDPFNQFDLCKRRCGKGDYLCVAKCNDELQKRINNEIMFSLSPSDQVLFQSEM
jgi:hypothetical protein